MKNRLISDEAFFSEALDLTREDMAEVRRAVQARDYASAGRAFADHVRESLQPERFFLTPYETPENIFKLPGESDREACERLCQYKLVSVGVLADFSAEHRVDWEANPTHNQYKEWTWQLNRHNEWKLLAHEYRKHGEEKYAQLTAELFASWVSQTKCPEALSGHESTCYRTIECGIRMGSNWPYVLHSFCHSPAFTDEILLAWYKSVYEQGRRLAHDSTSGNWLVMEMNGLAQIGILYPELKPAETWLKLALEALGEELAKQIYPDGFQYELTTGYHDVVINNYQRLFELMKAYSMELPESMLRVLEHAAELSVKLMMPDGHLPDINDGTKASAGELLLPKLRIFPSNEVLRWAASGQKEGARPAYRSCILPYAGIGIYRSGWGAEDSWLLFDAGPFGRGHQHEDKLSLLYYAGGKLLLTEGGNYAYDDSEMRRYVLSSFAHNTVLVDGQGQNRRKHYQWRDENIHTLSGLEWRLDTPDILDGMQDVDESDIEASGKTHIFSAKDIGKASDKPEKIFLRGSYRGLYGEDISDVVHERSVYVAYLPGQYHNPVLIVVDRLWAEKEHEYTVLWHVDAQQNTSECQGGRIDFEGIHLYHSAAMTAGLVCGQEKPRWQGFVALTPRQGDYRPVNCVELSARGRNLRLVSVFSLEDICDKLEAAAVPEAETLDLVCGSERVSLSEKQLRG